MLMLVASHGSAVCEVFLRKRFGERYITLAQSVGLFFLLLSLTLLADGMPKGFSVIPVVLFAFAFLIMSIIHRLEIKRYGTTYDFKRFSLSDGEIAPFWDKVIGTTIGPIKISRYLVVTLLEPAIPIVLGIFMMLIPFTFILGLLFFLCGILFAVSNFHKAQQGRNWVLDNIDKKISNEMKYDVFIGRKPKTDTKGVYLPIELPEDEETRKSLYNIVENSFTKADEIWVNDFLDEKESASMGNG